jgi:hypothetical protein
VKDDKIINKTLKTESQENKSSNDFIKDTEKIISRLDLEKLEKEELQEESAAKEDIKSPTEIKEQNIENKETNAKKEKKSRRKKNRDTPSEHFQTFNSIRDVLGDKGILKGKKMDNNYEYDIDDLMKQPEAVVIVLLNPAKPEVVY